MQKLASLAAAALLVGALVQMPAAAADAPVAGKDYTVVNPAQPTETKGKVVVIEFFSYGCPHCHEFDPLLEKWAKAGFAAPLHR